MLEPTLFGKSLNLTAISVFIGLVLWASLWGIPGAILSVPLLGAQKILLDAADYPLAKRMLHLMREDNSVEELIEARGFEGTEAFVKAHMEALDTVSKPHSVVHQHDLEQPHGNHASPCVLPCVTCLLKQKVWLSWSWGVVDRYDWTKQSDGSYDRVGSHPMPGHTPAPGLGSAGGVTRLEDPGAYENAICPQLHHQCGVSRSGDTASGEIDYWHSAHLLGLGQEF